MFTKGEWLTSTKISRYFSRLATLNRIGALHRTKEARPAPTEPVPDGGKAKVRRKTHTWLKLPSLKHGFKLEESLNCKFTID